MRSAFKDIFLTVNPITEWCWFGILVEADLLPSSGFKMNFLVKWYFGGISKFIMWSLFLLMRIFYQFVNKASIKQTRINTHKHMYTHPHAINRFKWILNKAHKLFTSDISSSQFESASTIWKCHLQVQAVWRKNRKFTQMNEVHMLGVEMFIGSNVEPDIRMK